MLTACARAGIAAFTAPRDGGHPQPAPVTYRLWVDSEHFRAAADALRQAVNEAHEHHADCRPSEDATLSHLDSEVSAVIGSTGRSEPWSCFNCGRSGVTRGSSRQLVRLPGHPAGEQDRSAPASPAT